MYYYEKYKMAERFLWGVSRAGVEVDGIKGRS
jgi:hypothetical protein